MPKLVAMHVLRGRNPTIRKLDVPGDGPTTFPNGADDRLRHTVDRGRMHERPMQTRCDVFPMSTDKTNDIARRSLKQFEHERRSDESCCTGHEMS